MIRAALLLTGVWAFVAVISALVMQAELFAPGLQIYLFEGAPAPGLHNEFRQTHAAIAATALPITALGALGCFKLASHRESGSLLNAGERLSGAALLLLAGAFALIGLAQGRWLPSFMPFISAAAMAAVAVSVAAALIAAIRTRSSRRAAAPWLVFSSVLLLLGLAMWIYSRQFGLTLLVDTSWTVAMWHSFGGAGWLLAFALVSALAAQSGRRVAGWPSVVLAGAITLAWSFMVISQARLGLAGMPRGYADYPETFSLWQVRAGVGAVLALALSGAAAVRIWLAPLSDDAPSPASVF